MEGSSAQAICSRRLRRGQIVRALAQLAHSRRRRRREPLIIRPICLDMTILRVFWGKFALALLSSILLLFLTGRNTICQRQKRPLKTWNCLKGLDSRLRGNDKLRNDWFGGLMLPVLSFPGMKIP